TIAVAEHREGVVDDLVRLAALDVGHETNAARFLIERRVIETLQLGPVAVSFVRKRAHLSRPHTPAGRQSPVGAPILPAPPASATVAGKCPLESWRAFCLRHRRQPGTAPGAAMRRPITR